MRMERTGRARGGGGVLGGGQAHLVDEWTVHATRRTVSWPCFLYLALGEERKVQRAGEGEISTSTQRGGYGRSLSDDASMVGT